jgi:amidase
MNLVEYASFDAIDLANLVRRKEIKAAELRDIGMEAIEAVNPRINAVIATTPEEAASALMRAQPDAPFAGVPFLIKDVGISYRGIPSESGCRMLKGQVPTEDCELAVRQKRAGLVTIGRTNTPELGNSASTEPVCNGPTRNPWDVHRSAGGSSGGAAAAVAAGITPIAHASDGGGSIRVPAANCGIFGMKPSRGRNPTGPDRDEILFGLVADHVVSRSVRDSAAMLDATSGIEVGSRIMVPPPSRPFLVSAERDPSPLRIAFSTQPVRGADRPHLDCVKMIKDVVTLCEDLGHELREDAPQVELDDVVEVFLVLGAASLQQTIAAAQRVNGRAANRSTLEATTLRTLEYADSLTPADLLGAFDALNRVSRSLGAFFSTCDVWLSPVLAGLPPLLGYMDADDAALSSIEWVQKIMKTCPYTAMFNQSGQPAMSVPLHWNSDGLPVGSHFVGHLGSEEILFSLAGQLERARPWTHRRPTVSTREIPSQFEALEIRGKDD